MADNLGSADTKRTSALAHQYLDQFLNKTRQPLISELKDDMTCFICTAPYMTGNAPEVPVKLPCGHLCGTHCILKWLSPLSTPGRRHNSCPKCRAPIFDIEDGKSEPEVVADQNVVTNILDAIHQPRAENPVSSAPVIQDSTAHRQGLHAEQGPNLPTRDVHPPARGANNSQLPASNTIGSNPMATNSGVGGPGPPVARYQDTAFREHLIELAQIQGRREEFAPRLPPQRRHERNTSNVFIGSHRPGNI